MQIEEKKKIWVKVTILASFFLPKRYLVILAAKVAAAVPGRQVPVPQDLRRAPDPPGGLPKPLVGAPGWPAAGTAPPAAPSLSVHTTMQEQLVMSNAAQAAPSQLPAPCFPAN